MFVNACKKQYGNSAPLHIMLCFQCLESMVNDGWVNAEFDPMLPLVNFKSSATSGNFVPNTDELTNRLDEQKA